MKKIMFTSEEIDKHKSDRKEWIYFVRSREAEMIFSQFSERNFDQALEIGAGNGVQSLTIAKYCNKLICTEKDDTSYDWTGQSILDRELENVEYKICDAQDLSQFGKKSFDLIFSSNVLEHIPDIRKCLNECRKVLKDDGLMLHTMPNRWWKILAHVFGVLKLKRLGIHGVSSSHWQEFINFGANAWIDLIESEGFNVKEVIGLPFYVGHGNSFIPVIKVGNALKISATYLYVIEKK